MGPHDCNAKAPAVSTAWCARFTLSAVAVDRPRPRGISSSGKRWAALIAVLVGMALPKHVKCGYPAAAGTCQVPGRFRQMCEPYELEPLGFFLVELALGRDVGFAYKTGQDCR